MDIYLVDLFRVRVDVTLVDLKGQLNQINRRLDHRDTGRVDNVGYRRLLIDSTVRLQFNQMMFKNDDDVRNMFSISDKYNMFLTINLDVSLLGSSENILTSLIWPDENV